jgi:adenosylcobyric acid synthase
MVSGALLVAGTTSDAGKSLVTAGICRWLAREGIKVAPFKAQNMSNNSLVVADGGEIGRAQAMQAQACGIAPEAAMNPVLLKPGDDRSSHVVLMGRPYARTTASSYGELKGGIRQTTLAAFDDLRDRFDVVVCEGAGSPAEINLRAHDLANMGLADARELPTIVVGDIDRGGVFASLHGTVALLSARDQSLIAGFVINKFRGDPSVLEPGIGMLHRLTGRRTYGVLPWLGGLDFDTEDSLGIRRDPPLVGPPVGRDALRVSVIALPHVSNSTDIDALAQEPGVCVRWTASPSEVPDADLVVLPGTRATVADLTWLHRQGLADAVSQRAQRGRPVLGVCGGFQMLARTITDQVESAIGTVDGLGLLPVDVDFAADKTLGRPTGEHYGQPVTTAYEIHHGIARIDEGARRFLDGVRVDAVWGTHWHGALDSDGFRREFLREVAAAAGRQFVPAKETDVAMLRSRRLDRLGNMIARHLDTDALLDLIESGPPRGLPFIPPGAP